MAEGFLIGAAVRGGMISPTVCTGNGQKRRSSLHPDKPLSPQRLVKLNIQAAVPAAIGLTGLLATGAARPSGHALCACCLRPSASGARFRRNDGGCRSDFSRDGRWHPGRIATEVAPASAIGLCGWFIAAGTAAPTKREAHVGWADKGSPTSRLGHPGRIAAKAASTAPVIPDAQRSGIQSRHSPLRGAPLIPAFSPQGEKGWTCGGFKMGG